MTVPELTEELIAEGMARAERVACQGNARCVARPDPLAEVRTTGTPKGRCKIGGTRRVIVADGGRMSWDVWRDLPTGEGRLCRRDERRHEAASPW
jgi:hypothetical protein